MNKIITLSLILLLSLTDIALAHSVVASESSATGHLESGNSAADLPQLWFDGGADGQEEIERLKALAQERISDNERRFAERTGQKRIPLSAPEYADESANDLRLLAQLDLLQASSDKGQYDYWYQNGIKRLEKLAKLAHTRGEAARAAQDPSQPYVAELFYRAEIDQTWRDASDGTLKDHIGDAVSPEAETFFKKLFWLGLARLI